MSTASVRCDLKRLDCTAQVAEQAVAGGGLPTAVVAVANSRETLWTHVVPGADGVSLDTIFLLASITKPVLATGVMQLVEQGRLSLHKPVASYLPEFGERGKQSVTAWHLLTHTSGMDESRWIAAVTQPGGECGTCFEEACATHLHFPPGTQCEYCTLSFAALGELIARIGGAAYPDYLREHVFAPLGMVDSAFQPGDPKRGAPVADFASPEHLARFTARALAGGGLWSTAADLVRFGQAYLGGGALGACRVLAPATIDAMTRMQTDGISAIADGKPVPFPYALGWGKPIPGRGAVASASAFSHGGATGTLLHVDPEWDLVFVFLTNRWGGDQDVASRALWTAYSALTR